jgi:4-hydroxy-3-methylbut-2-enyl diphosphate reductase
MEAVSGGKPVDFEWNDSICRQVSNRSVQLKEFASRFDVVVFVSGQKISNGMILYQACKDVNPATNLVSSLSEVKHEWFQNAHTVGICGATSTPMWLMEEIADGIRKING